MKKGHELKIRERLSKSYLQVIFIASISAIVGIIALLVMTRMYNNALNNYGFSQGDIGKAMTAFSGARSEVRAAVGYMDEDIISDAKDTYYTRKDSFQQYLDDIESSMVTQAGKDAYNQIVKDLDGYWDLSDQLIEEGSTTDQEISKKVQRREADELVENMLTGEVLRLEKTLVEDERVVIKTSHGKTTVTSSKDGDCRGALTLESTLYRIHTGDNAWKPTADSGLENVEMSVSFAEESAGVTVI